MSGGNTCQRLLIIDDYLLQALISAGEHFASCARRVDGRMRHPAEQPDLRPAQMDFTTSRAAQIRRILRAGRGKAELLNVARLPYDRCLVSPDRCRRFAPSSSAECTSLTSGSGWPSRAP